jgi:hypothetical protein
VASASDTSRSLHLPDGPEQEKRDRAIQSARHKERAGESDMPDQGTISSGKIIYGVTTRCVKR